MIGVATAPMVKTFADSIGEGLTSQPASAFVGIIPLALIIATFVAAIAVGRKKGV